MRCCCEFRARCISVRALRRLGGSRRRRTRRVSGCGRVRGKGSRARREDALPPARRLRRSRSAVRAAAGSSVPPRSGSLSPPCVARVLRDMTQIRCRAFRMTQEMRRARRPGARRAGKLPSHPFRPRHLSHFAHRDSPLRRSARIQLPSSGPRRRHPPLDDRSIVTRAGARVRRRQSRAGRTPLGKWSGTRDRREPSSLRLPGNGNGNGRRGARRHRRSGSRERLVPIRLVTRARARWDLVAGGGPSVFHAIALGVRGTRGRPHFSHFRSQIPRPRVRHRVHAGRSAGPRWTHA